VLTREQIVSVYRQLLERTPNEEEIEAQLAGPATLDELLRLVLDCDEYALRLRGRGYNPPTAPPVVNVFHPDLAVWGPPPGTRSADGIAIVGHEGWLFLCGGTNANLGQYVGEVEMKPAWLQGWQRLIVERGAEIGALGVASAWLVVPDKLAVYEDRYPEELVHVGPRPIERLLELADMPLTYPLAELQRAAADEEVYLRTDTHLTFRGNELLFSLVAAQLGIEESPDLGSLPLRSYLTAGDLGAKFEPAILSVVSDPGSLLDAAIIKDNRAEIEAVGGHVGTRRVFRNEGAPDPRVAVVFGDSFGFGAPHYQGLSWFMAQVFREVHFVWIPFGWDPDYVEQVGAEAVLIQGAERFVARVPRLRIEVARLTEETLRRKVADQY
jgi:hypothetical protein